MSIRIILADDHKIVRTSLGNLLEKEKEFEIVGEADNGRETVRLARELLPDVVIMDIGMPELNGIEATKQIIKASDNIKIIALSMHSDRMFITGMFKAGASGYLLKDCAFDELVDAINNVMNGKIYLSKDVTAIVVDELLQALLKDNPEGTVNLSDREKEVLQLIAEGKSTKEIANALFLSIKTIESHRKNIMTKLNIYTVPELTKYAVRMGLTSLN
jgi:DNA-binding NarL/FixJ family response regulator